MINISNYCFKDKYLQCLCHEGKIKLSEEEISRLQSLNLTDILTYLLQKDPSIQAKQANSIANNINSFNKEKMDYNIDTFNNKNQSGILVCSFSADNESILMWSHYAENHKGFCLEYDFRKLGIENILNRAMQPVIYEDKLLDIDKYIPKSIDGIKKFNNLIVNLFAMIKATAWKYENEWRLVLPLGSTEPFNMKVPKPVALYLGSEISKYDEEMLIQIANWKRIPTFKMQMEKESFHLFSEQIK